ncbi:MAG: RimK-like ATPgrasp N-terminal domain-containing protein [Archaeoglobaceae archaeon]|nr:RimK-like ATPgrasp N-terminal domain-containing protein [Archaeoglobaceae archaeon]MDW7989456.1 RimK-like ATPgrasp N-terminal domain-containing protein [Archaeoglobaceae archaeon]
MILVGEGDEEKSLEPPDHFLKKKVSDTILNLLGDYRFHTKGYYVSLHAEENNCIVYPSVKNALDIYRAPVFIERLNRSGLNVPNFEVLPRPIPRKTVMLPLNPFSKNSMKIVRNESQYYRCFRSLSMDYHYPVVQVEIEGKIEEIYMHLTKARKGDEEMNRIAKKVFEIFGVPLGKIFVEKIDGKLKPFYFMPLMKDEIDLDFAIEVMHEDRLFR